MKIRWDPSVHGVATSVKNAVPETETKLVQKKRARAHQQSKESAMAIAKSFQLQIKNHRNDNSFQFKRHAKRSTSGRHRSKKKKEQQRGGTKEDKSLRGTTTKLVCVVPVINETPIETNSRQSMIDLQGWQREKYVYNTIPATTRRRVKRQQEKEEKEESTIEQK